MKRFLKQFEVMRFKNNTRRLIDKFGVCYVKLRQPKKLVAPKVKLVAIAKDESAYLTDWIFHHLHFGFDQLVVYINNTTDNSEEIISSLKGLTKVKFKNGDPYFLNAKRSPQMAIYGNELRKSRWQGFSHVMFLDIDEFYVPSDFRLNVKDLVREMWADVCCLEWVHRMDETESFLEPFQNKMSGRRAQQVKSIVSTTIIPSSANPHNMLSANCRYQLADGNEYKVSIDNFSRVPVEELKKNIKQAFVLHRMVRSEYEYVAALKRGRPMSDEKQGSIFKNNRSGIFDDTKNYNFHFPIDLIQSYLDKKATFIHQFNLNSRIVKGRMLVSERYKSILEMIKTAPMSEFETLEKVLKNITLEDVLDAYNQYLNRHQIDKL